MNPDVESLAWLPESSDGAASGVQCALACHVAAQAFFDECRNLRSFDICAGVPDLASGCDPIGLTVFECGAAVRKMLANCLWTQCGTRIETPPCELACRVEAEWAFYECRRSGGDPRQCGMIGMDNGRRCLRETCGAPPSCENGCVQIRLPDQPRDAVLRPTDPQLRLPFDVAAHPPIDLIELRLGSWAPAEPASDLFRGTFDASGAFARIDLELAGLVNPPGNPTPEGFDPFVHGNRPVYGFVEIDMDDNVWTGGEIESPEFRYLGNAARFGGLPSRPAFADRVAVEGSAFDRRFVSPPYVERHGEEFHIALTGTVPFDIHERFGDGDAIFEPAETWILTGRFLHRAHGYEWFSFADGGLVAGAYEPMCHLQFRHVPGENRTYVSLVLPLTQVGAGLMRNEPAAPMNHSAADQASILEGLTDLCDSAAWLRLIPTGLPEEDIIIDWADQNPGEYLDPTRWSATALLGTMYSRPHPEKLFFVWTDIHPDVTPGDVDGNGFRTALDVAAIRRFVNAHDAADGVIDDAVRLDGFASDFDVLDVNYDGVIDGADAILLTGDGDGDWSVTLADYARFQCCFSRDGRFPPCLSMDFDQDGEVDRDDFQVLRWVLNGSNAP
jgi:hypothetical protein